MSRFFGNRLHRVLRESITDDGGAGGGSEGGKEGGSEGGSNGGKEGGSEGGKVTALGDNWRDNLDATIKDDPTLTTIKSVEDLAKGYVNARKMIGADKVVLPGKHATEEQWDQFYAKVGLPEQGNYKIDLPNGMELTDENKKELIEAAHKNRIMPNQLSGILEWIGAKNKQTIEDNNALMAKDLQKSQGELKNEWSYKYQDNIEVAKQALKDLTQDNPGLYKEIADSKIGEQPFFIKLMHKIGELQKDDRININAGSAASGLDEVKKKITELRASEAYFDNKHPRHSIVVEEVNGLWDQKVSLEERLAAN